MCSADHAAALHAGIKRTAAETEQDADRRITLVLCLEVADSCGSAEQLAVQKHPRTQVLALREQAPHSHIDGSSTRSDTREREQIRRRCFDQIDSGARSHNQPESGHRTRRVSLERASGREGREHKSRRRGKELPRPSVLLRDGCSSAQLKRQIRKRGRSRERAQIARSGVILRALESAGAGGLAEEVNPAPLLSSGFRPALPNAPGTVER
jgi:hypothetical protein